ncbi:MAG: hypothetical protein K2X25_00735 [Caulobacteraceae bacterium]|nr:hypothetical protein [Caulobacteraceae bacterium]
MLTAVVLASLIASGDPDGVVSTAPKGTGAVAVGAVAPTAEARPDASQAGRVTTQDLTTAEQIDRWISAPGRDVAPFADSMGPGDDRRMHGFVSGSIGTDDYSSVSVGVSLPIGENGRLDLSYSQTKNGWGYPGYGYGEPGYGYGYGGPFGVRDPFYGAGYGYGVRSGVGYRSGRSMSLGFRWDEDKDRRERVSAED